MLATEPESTFHPESMLPLALDAWSESSIKVGSKETKFYKKVEDHTRDLITLVTNTVEYKIRREHQETFRLNWQEFAQTQGTSGKFSVHEDTNSLTPTPNEPIGENQYRWLNENTTSELILNKKGELVGAETTKNMRFFATAEMPTLDGIPHSEAQIRATIHLPSDEKKNWNVRFTLYTSPDIFHVNPDGSMHLSMQPQNQYEITLEGNAFQIYDMNQTKTLVKLQRSADGSVLDMKPLGRKNAGIELVNSIATATRTLLGIDIFGTPGHIGSLIASSAKTAIGQK